MNYAYISRTVARLRVELNQIGLENRSYFTKKRHGEGEILDHQLLTDRVQEIKIELEKLMTSCGGFCPHNTVPTICPLTGPSVE